MPGISGTISPEYPCNTYDCIAHDKNLKKRFYFVSRSETVAIRLFNALTHLFLLIKQEGNLTTIDPFDNYDVNKIKSSFLIVKPVSIEEQNVNQRIDENETVIFLFDIQNQGKGSAKNVDVLITEINNVPGLIYKSSYTIPLIAPNDKVTAKIPIQANSEIEINQAEFRIKINEEKAKVDELSISIPTYRSANKNLVVSKVSDVDINIPKSYSKNINLFALVIGNEDYSSYQQNLLSESNVPYAQNDAIVVSKYIENTFGAPNENIITIINGTKAKIEQAVKKLQLITEINTSAEIIIYYAGHGLPEPETNDQILIPVDVTPGNYEKFGIKLNDIISELTKVPTKRITIFIDACFSGGARDQGLLASRRVKVKPKAPYLQGNVIIFSSSSNEEESGAYHQEKHGLFTYYFLKKVQETRGKVTYKELYDFLQKNVVLRSVLVNDKNQTPTVQFSNEVEFYWENWKLVD
jgi:hypothetical protein